MVVIMGIRYKYVKRFIKSCFAWSHWQCYRRVYFLQCGITYLLHVSQHILPAVKHSLSFFRVQLVDEVGSVVFITVLIPKNTR